ncbi:MAG: hypothetical protein FK733_16090 [Asgard group archaeon]|nr:hypothetical protein [Asgard group archaeon]
MKTILILTQPRSGSSLLAGILHKLGVWMGPDDDLLMSQHKNELGSYENQEFLKISHNILLKAKRLMYYANRFSDDDGRVEKAVKKYEEKLVKLIRESEREYWGFKEAVIIYTLPYFHHHLKDPHYIILHRDAESIANSQVRAGKLSNWLPEIKTELSYFRIYQWFILLFRTVWTTITKGFLYRKLDFIIKLTEDGHERINKFVKDKKHIRIDLTELIENPEVEIKKIITFLKLQPTDQQLKEALDFVHPELITSEIK